MNSLFDESRQTKKSVMGSSTPLTTWTPMSSADHGDAGDQRDDRPDRDQRGDDADEDGRFAGAARDAFLEPECSATT